MFTGERSTVRTRGHEGSGREMMPRRGMEGPEASSPKEQHPCPSERKGWVWI